MTLWCVLSMCRSAAWSAASRPRNGYALPMSRHREAHIIPGSKGAWEVVEPGAGAAHSQHSTKREAVEQAKDLLQRHGGGEAVVHGRDGRIRQSESVDGAGKSQRHSK
jgi:Uncharacterized protein conserved in bacteria (DUF2188)